jgi:enterochelin esterase-like enzyme
MNRLWHALLSSCILLGLGLGSCAEEPTAQQIIDRHASEKSAVWTDGDAATFFWRGEAEQVKLHFGGEAMNLKRLTEDVWTVRVTRPQLQRGVFSYAIVPRKRGKEERPRFQTWRGREAPPAPLVATKFQGANKKIEFDSKVLDERRALNVYLPPNHDRSKSYPVIYAADGMNNADVLEPLILAGKLPPLIAVGVSSGVYQGDPAKTYSIKKDLRALEYLPGVDNARFAKHERFLCEELRAWAQREFGASSSRAERVVFGVSNGGRFAFEMGARHPDLFGHVYAFSVAGKRKYEPFSKPANAPDFYLAAGTWEKAFHTITEELGKDLTQNGVRHIFSSRVASHDPAMWRDEFAKAVQRSFGVSTPSG